MSSVNFLEKLLDGVTVEWKTVDEIFNLKNGYTPSKNNNDFWEGGDIPWFRMEDIRFNGRILSDAIQKITQSALKGKIFPANSLVMSTTATLGEHALVTVPHLTNQQITNFSIRENLKDAINIKYLYHCFFAFGKWCQENANKSGGMGIIGIHKLKQYEIPIPCPENPKKSLEIQAEIVRILDAMTAHTAELTAELTARKKQYNYYRDKLLSFEDGEVEVEWKKLGDILKTIKTGKLNANAMVDNGRYPFFTCDSKPFKIDTYAFDTEAIIVSGNGSQVGHINYYKGKFNAYQRTYILADCIKEMKIEFLLIYLKAYLRAYIMRHSKKGSVPYITMPMLENFLAPVPSIEKQIQIFSALSKFEILTESMIQGLPKEIELREKQYSYYRELLLNFKNPKEQPLWN